MRPTQQHLIDDTPLGLFGGNGCGQASASDPQTCPGRPSACTRIDATPDPVPQAILPRCIYNGDLYEVTREGKAKLTLRNVETGEVRHVDPHYVSRLPESPTYSPAPPLAPVQYCPLCQKPATGSDHAPYCSKRCDTRATKLAAKMVVEKAQQAATLKTSGIASLKCLQCHKKPAVALAEGRVAVYCSKKCLTAHQAEMGRFNRALNATEIVDGQQTLIQE
jgi:endogenous inhibitor of DNA gyrase (YacG/DUF329 family)